MKYQSQSVGESFFLLHKPKPEGATGRGLSPVTSHLFEELYRAFWNPFYGYLRSEGYSHCDAEDLVEGMFAHLIERDHFDGGHCPDARCSTCRNPRCYAYLLSGLRNHVSNEHDRTHSLRRGSAYHFVSWEDDPSGDAMRYEASCSPTPVDNLEAKWASAVMDQAISRLRSEVADSVSPGLFDCLEELVSGERSHGDYATIAAKWGLSKPALRMIVLRLRRRLAKILLAALTRDGCSLPSSGCHRIVFDESRMSHAAVVVLPIEPVKDVGGQAVA